MEIIAYIIRYEISTCKDLRLGIFQAEKLCLIRLRGDEESESENPFIVQNFNPDARTVPTQPN